MTKPQLDAIIAKLAQDFPDSDAWLTVECFADWLTKYQREAEVDGEQWYADRPDGDSALVTRVEALCKHPSMSFHQRALLEGAISDSLSPTGRKPSQPEYQSFRPSSLPKWACRYNKDRAPTEVYKATAEQVINQSRSYPSNPVAPATLSRTEIANLMRTEWTHQHDDLITAFVPADNGGGVAAFSVGRVFLGRLNIFRIENAAKAEAAAQDYLFKLVSPDDHTCNWVQKGSKVYCTICEGKPATAEVLRFSCDGCGRKFTPAKTTDTLCFDCKEAHSL